MLALCDTLVTKQTSMKDCSMFCGKFWHTRACLRQLLFSRTIASNSRSDALPGPR